jgi:hypothetical protein
MERGGQPQRGDIMDHKINQLRAEAAIAGDLDMVEICDRALAGDEEAADAVAEAIKAAEAMND